MEPTRNNQIVFPGMCKYGALKESSKCVAKDYFHLMRIDWLQAKGWKGQNVKIIVLEKGIDPSHPALNNSVISRINIKQQGSIKEIQHGTHVCGIISGEFNEDQCHIGAAPEVKAIVSFAGEMQHFTDVDDICIVNWSGGYCNELQELIGKSAFAILQNFSELIARNIELRAYGSQIRTIAEIDDNIERDQAIISFNEKIQECINCSLGKIFQDRLVITSIGNESVNLSEKIDQLNYFASHLMDVKIRNNSINVMSIHPTSMLPSNFSNTPGNEFAQETICAIGQDVLSTLPEGKYGRLSGTSMASPFVTAVAASLKNAYPELTHFQIRHCILEGASPIILDENNYPQLLVSRDDLVNYSESQVKYSQNIYGVGLLNAKGAFKIAQQIVALSHKSSII